MALADGVGRRPRETDQILPCPLMTSARTPAATSPPNARATLSAVRQAMTRYVERRGLTLNARESATSAICPQPRREPTRIGTVSNGSARTIRRA